MRFNFLIPKKLAVEATKSNINDLELKKKANEEERKKSTRKQKNLEKS